MPATWSWYLSSDEEEKLGYIGRKTERKVCTVRQQTKKAIDALTSQVHLLRAVAFCPEHLNDYLSLHVTVECDKDVAFCSMTRECYLRQARANMSDIFLNLPVYSKLGPETAQKKWLSKEKR